MRRVALAAVFLLVCPIALARHPHATATPGRVSPCDKVFAKAELQPEVQKVDWPVTGATGDAQKYFSQGMTEYYGFNYEEAMRNFREAKKIAPNMAMASWGIALAAGPNINISMDQGCRALAVSEMACALALTKNPSLRFTPVEVGLIEALALRYAAPLTETAAYSVAMSRIWDDLPAYGDPWSDEDKRNIANVGALYAESMIELRPWGLFDAAYRKALDTPAILGVLKKSMAAEPKAIGANHFYIHAIEASDTPELGETSANVLRDVAPGAGHLLHMPSHIYLLMGDYKGAMDSNTAAVRKDIEQYGEPCKGEYADYSKNERCPQLYYGHYLSHNLFFRAVAAAFAGQKQNMVTWAEETRDHARHFVANEPGLQRYLTPPLMAMVMNRDWNGIFKQSTDQAMLDNCYMAPSFPGNGCHIYRAMLHWARGMAYASDGDPAHQGEDGLKLARDEYDRMALQMQEIAPPTPTGWGNNTAAAVLAIAQSTLQARYTWAGGQCKPAECKQPCDPAREPKECEAIGYCVVSRCPSGQCWNVQLQAIEHLKLAVTHEDALVYDEPPQWFPRTREALGGAYIRILRFQLASDTFDEELIRFPKSGRALWGKVQSLQQLIAVTKDENQLAKLKRDAADYTSRFCQAWTNADYTMGMDDLWPHPFGSGGITVYPVTCPPK